MFERMTLYTASEAIGLNCRFLQAPDGHVAKGTLRSYTEDASVLHIKQHMMQGKESQASLVNYKKGGQVHSSCTFCMDMMFRVSC